jgi:autoinducer 2-degrading protein
LPSGHAKSLLRGVAVAWWGAACRDGAAMYVVLVHLHIKPECIDAFLAITRENVENTRKEPGNVRFDVVRMNDDPNRFKFYEVYVDEAAFRAHQTQPYYFKWREVAEPLQAERRTGERATTVFPEPYC